MIYCVSAQPGLAAITAHAGYLGLITQTGVTVAKFIHEGKITWISIQEVIFPVWDFNRYSHVPLLLEPYGGEET